MLLQPELAEFRNRNFLPDLIQNLEQQIGTLSYPEPEWSRLIFKLREAMAKQAPDFVAKVLVEMGVQIATRR